MAKFEDIEIAEWDKIGVEDRARLLRRRRLLRRWADELYPDIMDPDVMELDPPTIKCTASCCGNDALFRLELSEHDDEPRRVSFRCGDHVATWMMANAPFGSIKADLL